MSNNDIISFSDMFKDEIPKPKNDPIADLPLNPPASKDETLQVNVYYRTFDLIKDLTKEKTHEELCKMLTQYMHLPVTNDEVSDYIKDVQTCPAEDEWVLLYFTVCAVWRRIMENLSIDVSFDHLKSTESLKKMFKNDSRTGTENPIITMYLGAVVSNVYLTLSKELQDLLPELLDPTMSNMNQSEASKMTPFVLITLGLITLEMCNYRVIDCGPVNDWYNEFELDDKSTYEEIVNSSKLCFGRRLGS